MGYGKKEVREGKEVIKSRFSLREETVRQTGTGFWVVEAERDLKDDGEEVKNEKIVLEATKKEREGLDSE